MFYLWRAERMAAPSGVFMKAMTSLLEMSSRCRKKGFFIGYLLRKFSTFRCYR